jgi:RNA polymerase sigma-70 factor, ECF subfamily
MSTTATQPDFVQLTAEYRAELLAHCYRMLGSVHDAEDLVQETYLRAWRSYDNFEGRASLRTWLYRIATNACLTALESRSKRPLPSALGAPSDDPERPPAELWEVPWLQPLPDAVLGTTPEDPAATVTVRDSTRLALVAALQHLPPRQRAVLILRDVLAWRAAEVADLLDTTTAAVNSALQRARAQLDAVSPSEDDTPALTDPEQRALLERYAAAFENQDMDALLGLLRADAVWEMPPHLDWYLGPENIVKLITTHCPATPGGLRMIPASANGQPAFATYLRDADGVFRAYQVQVLETDGHQVTHAVAWFDTSLFPTFGLPMVHPAPDATAVRR